MTDGAYSGDPATSPRDEVRFLIGDTTQPFKLDDAEVDYLLAKWLPLYASTYFVASVAARALARGYAGMPTVSADGVSVDFASLVTTYNALADSLRSQYEDEIVLSGNAGSWEDVLFDSEFHPRVFEMGNMDIEGLKQGGYRNTNVRGAYEHSEYDGFLA